MARRISAFIHNQEKLATFSIKKIEIRISRALSSLEETTECHLSFGHDESPTWRGDCGSGFPNVAIPQKRQLQQMTSKLDQSNSQVNTEWIDEWGNMVRGSWRITTYFLYAVPVDCRCKMLNQRGGRKNSKQDHQRSRVAKQSTTPLKPSSEEGTSELTTNYRISEGKPKNWPVLISRSNVNSVA